MNISDLVKDWGGFENLIAQLHETGEVTVEHNVVIPGRSGAPRQIDVLIRHKQGLYEHFVVAECKYWRTPVERLHVDALAITVREVRASQGVIFSTKGFQAGAITQAAHDNIDLFVVRDLTDEEWGLPGRHVDLFLHAVGISIGNVQFHTPFSYPGEEPSNPKLDLHIGKPDTDSHTPIAWEGKNDKTLEEMLSRVARETAQKSFKPVPVQFENGFDGEMRFRVQVDIKPQTPIRASVNGGTVFFPRITFDLGVSITQSRIQIDKAEKYSFALAVEDCVKRNVIAATRCNSDDVTTLTSLNLVAPAASEDVFKNGSLMTLWLEGLQAFDGFADLEPGRMIFVEPSKSTEKK